MLNKRMFMSIFILGLAVTLAGAGTWASLQDTESSNGNSMTAGTLDLKLSNGGTPSQYSDGVTGTWTSPVNFKPGDTFTKELRFTNIGTIDAKHIYMYPDLDPSVFRAGIGGGDLSDAIIITNIQGHFPGYYGINLVNGIFGIGGLRWTAGNGDGKLTLKEFCDLDFVAFSLGSPVLKAKDKKDFGLLLNGKFDRDADNTFQGASCGFTLKAVASQNSPTDGYVLVDDEETTSSPDDVSEEETTT